MLATIPKQTVGLDFSSNTKNISHLLVLFLVLIQSVQGSLRTEQRIEAKKDQVRKLLSNNLSALPPKYVYLANKFLADQLPADEHQGFIEDTSKLHETRLVSIAMEHALVQVEQLYRMHRFVSQHKALIVAGQNYVQLEELDRLLGSMKKTADRASLIVVKFPALSSVKEAQKLMKEFEKVIQKEHSRDYEQAKQIIAKTKPAIEKSLEELSDQRVLSLTGKILFQIAGAMGNDYASRYKKIGHMETTSFVDRFSVALKFGNNMLEGQIDDIEQLMEIFVEQFAHLELSEQSLMDIHEAINSNQEWMQQYGQEYYFALLEKEYKNK